MDEPKHQEIDPGPKWQYSKGCTFFINGEKAEIQAIRMILHTGQGSFWDIEIDGLQPVEGDDISIRSCNKYGDPCELNIFEMKRNKIGTWAGKMHWWHTEEKQTR